MAIMDEPPEVSDMPKKCWEEMGRVEALGGGK